ncbi:hypothetical protein ACWD4B_20415 [Streptomyces sp. NPDC002536]
MGRASAKDERRATRRERRSAGTGETAGRIPHTRSSGALPAVLHVVAHPCDALTVTGPELRRSLQEHGRPVVVACLTPGETQGRRALLGALGDDGSWNEHAEELPGGSVLRLHTFATAPHVRVCFLEAGPQPVDLTECTGHLLERFGPGTVLTLDPDPEHTGWSDETGARYADHPEHGAVARAVLEAVHRHTARGTGEAPVIECFRAAESCEEHTARRAAVVRYPGRRVWLTHGRDGRLTAYAAVGGGLVRWTETSPGGPEWSNRTTIPSPPLLPVLSVAQSPEGWVHLVSLRRTPGDSGRGPVEVMHTVQYQTGRPTGAWRSLGNPNGTHPVKGREAGVPAVVVDQDGCAHVFARNFGRGVSARSQQPNGVWGPWRDIQGSGVRDGLAAVLDDDGRPELFGASPAGVLHWQHGPEGGTLQQVPRPLPLSAEPGSALAALRTGPGGTTVYGCAAHDGVLGAVRTDGAAGSLGGAGGHGVTAVRTVIGGYDCTVLLQRSAEGDTAVGAFPTGYESPGLWWQRTGGQGVREPAAAADAHGRLVVASLGLDGRLQVARQVPDGQTFLLGEWTTV